MDREVLTESPEGYALPLLTFTKLEVVAFRYTSGG
jgi:hypothetical protein